MMIIKDISYSEFRKVALLHYVVEPVIFKAHAIGRVSTSIPNYGTSACGSYHDFILLNKPIFGCVFNPRFAFPQIAIEISQGVNNHLNSPIFLERDYYMLCKLCTKYVFDNDILDKYIRDSLK